MHEPLSDFALGCRLAFAGFLLFAIVLVVLIIRTTGHDSYAEHQTTLRTQAKLAACKTAPQPQTCLEFVVNPNLIIYANGSVNLPTTTLPQVGAVGVPTPTTTP